MRLDHINGAPHANYTVSQKKGATLPMAI